MMSDNKGHDLLERAFQQLLRTSSDSTLTDTQRRRILYGIRLMLKGRDEYEKVLRDVREKNLEEALAGFWQIIEDTPQLEIDPLDEDISLFFSNPPEPPDTLDDNEDD